MAAQHDRCGNLHISCLIMDLSPVVKQSIFQNHTLWKEEREARSLFFHHKQAKLFSKLSVVTFLCFLHTGDVLFKICLFGIGGSVDSGKHFVLLAASPVSSCKAGKLKRFYRLCCHQVRACAEIHKLSLLIEADLRIFRKILNKLYLIRFIFFFKKFNSLCSWFCKSGNGQVLFYDFFHLSLDLRKIFCCDRLITVNIIIEAILNRRSNCKLHLREKAFDSLSHNMGSGMTECSFAALTVKGEDIQLTVSVNHCTKIYNLSVHFTCTCYACKTFTDIGSNLNN